MSFLSRSTPSRSTASIVVCMLILTLCCQVQGVGPDTKIGSTDGDIYDEPGSSIRDGSVEVAGSPFNQSGLEAAADYSEARGGSAVLVMYRGQIIFEEYQNGADENTATHIHSATKGFWSSMLAAAMEDGLVTGYDEIVADTITEWQDQNEHPGKAEITVGHLASLSSGLSQDVDQIQGLNAQEPDIYQYVVDELDMNWRAGAKFQYGPSHYYAFGEFLSRKLEANEQDPDPLSYLMGRILDPIGVDYDYWERDDAGNPHIPNGCNITPRNWVRYGRFILQNGQWDGVPVVDEDRMKSLRTVDGPNPGHARFLWSNGQGGYGVTPTQVAPEGSPGGFIFHDGYCDIVAALGAGKNRMYIIPQLDAVVLRQTTREADAFEDHDFLERLLPTTVAVDDSASTCEDDEVIIDVLANDIDADDDPLFIHSVDQPATGTVVHNETTVAYRPAANHSGTDRFSYTMSDGKGGYDTATVTVNVTPINDPPVAVFYASPVSGDAPLDVGFDASGTFDVEGDDLSFGWDFGDSAAGSGPVTNHTYGEAGAYTVILTVTDGPGEASTAVLNITVTNRPPEGTLSLLTESPAEGAPVELSLEVRDTPGDLAGILCAWDPGDGSDVVNTAETGFTHVYADDGDYTVSVTVDDGTDATVVSMDLAVANVPPAVDVSGLAEGYSEGENLALDASGTTDVPADLADLAFTWTWEGGTYSGATLDVPLLRSGTFPVTLEVSDDRDTSTTTLDVVVSNLPPEARITVSDDEVEVGNPVTFDGSGSSDTPGDLENLTFSWDLGDGATGDGENVEHTYSEPGDHRVTLTVIDDDGAKDLAEIVVSVAAADGSGGGGQDGEDGDQSDDEGGGDDDEDDGGGLDGNGHGDGSGPGGIDPNQDSDGDGFPDWWEEDMGHDPGDPDDPAPSGAEDDDLVDDYLLHDSDGDGFYDWWELKEGYDPEDALDPDPSAAGDLLNDQSSALAEERERVEGGRQTEDDESDDGGNALLLLVAAAVAVVVTVLLAALLYPRMKKRRSADRFVNGIEEDQNNDDPPPV